MAKDEEDVDEEVEESRNWKRMAIICAAALVLVVAGGGYFLKFRHHGAHKQAHKPPPKEHYISLKRFVVNANQTGQQPSYVVIKVSLGSHEAKIGKRVKANKARLRAQLLSQILDDAKLEALPKSPQARTHLRLSLKSASNTVLGNHKHPNPINAIYLTKVIAQ